jgi:TrpR family transcriptional regulator, trp operon repressor
MMKHSKNTTQLANAIRELSSDSELIDFLEGILTHGELIDIGQRLQIVKKLKQGIPQRVISEDLGVGIATVTRGSKEIQKGRFKNV